MNYLEITANFFNVISTFFVSRNSLHTWWTGIVSYLLFVMVFFQVKLYADVSLQIFFIITCVLGWINWKYGGAQKKPLPVSRVTLKYFLACIAAALCGTFIYGSILLHFTQASCPFWDSAVLVFSITAQLFVMKRKFENWYLWFIADTIAIPLYYSKGLHLTALLYVGLMCIGVYGYFCWKRELSGC
ncbi:MAG: nicotinamide riboside transporter PnuC [Bdellovibrionota bacterium]